VKKIWISGASSGIGRALAIESAKRGYLVYGTSRSIERLTDLSKLVDSVVDFANFQVSVCDISNRSEVEKYVKGAFGDNAPDVLINSAGVTSFKEALDTDLEETEQIIFTNLLGSIYTIKSVLPAMVKRRSGMIVNINSVAALDRLKGSSVYSATKAGLLQFSRVLREEVRENNIKIIDILPGATETPIWHEKVRAKYSDKMMSPEKLAGYIIDFVEDESNIVQEEVVFRPITGNL